MTPTQPAPPRLRRVTHDRVIFGVCAGLGAYFQVDPVLVRIAFVFATLAGGAGIPLYVILAIVIPSETDAEALEGFHLLCRMEGLIPALESSHAIAYLKTLAPQLGRDKTILVCLSGRGDKDVDTVAKAMGEEIRG